MANPVDIEDRMEALLRERKQKASSSKKPAKKAAPLAKDAVEAAAEDNRPVSPAGHETDPKGPVAKRTRQKAAPSFRAKPGRAEGLKSAGGEPTTQMAFLLTDRQKAAIQGAVHIDHEAANESDLVRRLINERFGLYGDYEG